MNKLKNKRFGGFTLVEVVIVAAVTIIISTSLILSFSRKRIYLQESASIFVANIRLAQSKALATEKFNGYAPCGFGLRYKTSTTYALYAGPNSSTTDCATQNRNFGSGDTEIATYGFVDQRVQFQASFNDIFFEPPDPKTFINNNPSLSQAPARMEVMKKGGACPGDCIHVCIHASGRIELKAIGDCY